MSSRRRPPGPRPPKKRKRGETSGPRTESTRRVYDTADLARWFRVSVDEIRAWIAARAHLTPKGWVVVLHQMIGHRRREGLPWRFTMLPRATRRGISRPPTAARRAYGRKARKARKTRKAHSTGKRLR